MSTRLPATVHPGEAARRTWPVIVVGAGVAGATLAASLAGGGRRVLVIDKSPFPRAKVCGGTLNPRAVASLRRLGLGNVLDSLRPNRVFGVEWRMPSAAPALLEFDPSAEALAVSREALDAALLREAVARGADFLPGVRCVSSRVEGEARVLGLMTSAGSVPGISADLVLGCDGLGSGLAADAGLCAPAPRRGPDYIGTSIVLPPDCVLGVPPDRIVMAVGVRGYAGAVRVEGGRWNVAAAIRVDGLRAAGGPALVAEEILGSCGVRILEGSAPRAWCVSRPGLDRAVVRPWGERLLLVGDAGGYVEPVTGEGMAWALHSVEALQDLLRDGWSEGVGAAWEGTWRRTIRDRRALVRAAGSAARSPTATRAALAGLRVVPGVGRWIARFLTADVPLGRAAAR